MLRKSLTLQAFSAFLCFKDERGASAIEYTLLVALMLVVIVGVIATLGETLLATWEAIIVAVQG